MKVSQDCKYPVVDINLSKINHNIVEMVKICKEKNIEIAGVVKGFNGLSGVVKEFVNGGCKYIATSRINQVIKLKEDGIQGPFMLIRIPMLSEIKNLVKYVDISLNSEISIIEEINKECECQSKKHRVVIMADLGDLREGFWDKNKLIKVAEYVENHLSSIELAGIGTNLGCYGSIKPTMGKMNELCSLAEKIEKKINRKLDIISGGGTSSIPLVLQNKMPKRINNLRIGEGIILARDLQEFWGLDMSFMYQDAFTLKAEIIEIKNKPSHPVGEIFIDAFGNRPTYIDRGVRKRAIVGIGKLDYAINNKIMPRKDRIDIIGSSSDHLIVDVEDYNGDLAVGDILEFDMYYPAMMYLTNSQYVSITYSGFSKAYN